MTQRRSAAFAATCFVTLAAIAPAHAAGHHKRHSHRAYARSYRKTTSRGWSDNTQPTVVGRLAKVTVDSAEIRGGRDRMGRVISVCPKGQYLAINSETPTTYGVLMVDRSIGYIAKSDVQLLDYQVVNDQPTSPDAGSAADGSLGSRLVQEAFTYLSVPYLWGGDTRNGIDCSGFVKAVFESQGLSLPRVSRDQATVGYDVPLRDVSQWLPGDRMYFACHHPEIDHTAMYIGNGRFIHASAGHGHQVAVDSVTNEYYWRHLVAVRRSVELERDDQQMASRQQPTVTMASTTAASSEQPSMANQPPASQPPSMPSVSDDRTVPPAADTTATSGDPEADQQ